MLRRARYRGPPLSSSSNKIEFSCPLGSARGERRPPCAPGQQCGRIRSCLSEHPDLWTVMAALWPHRLTDCASAGRPPETVHSTGIRRFRQPAAIVGVTALVTAETKRSADAASSPPRDKVYRPIFEGWPKRLPATYQVQRGYLNRNHVEGIASISRHRRQDGAGRAGLRAADVFLHPLRRDRSFR